MSLSWLICQNRAIFSSYCTHGGPCALRGESRIRLKTRDRQKEEFVLRREKKKPCKSHLQSHRTYLGGCDRSISTLKASLVGKFSASYAYVWIKFLLRVRFFERLLKNIKTKIANKIIRQQNIPNLLPSAVGKTKIDMTVETTNFGCSSINQS